MGVAACTRRAFRDCSARQSLHTLMLIEESVGQGGKQAGQAISVMGNCCILTGNRGAICVDSVNVNLHGIRLSACSPVQDLLVAEDGRDAVAELAERRPPVW